MSLFSRIDRIRGGNGARGEQDRDDEGVFAIPDLGKNAATAPAPPSEPTSFGASSPASFVEAKIAPAGESSVEVVSAETAPTATAAVVEVADAPDKPAKRLSPLERLARRTEELEDDVEGDLPDPHIPERPATSLLVERLKADFLPDVVAPVTDSSADEAAPVVEMGHDEVPLPHAPFRRPALFDEPISASLPDVVAPKESATARLAREENAAQAPVSSAPREAADGSDSPISSAPMSPISSGTTAFDRLMAARAGAEARPVADGKNAAEAGETPKTAAPTLAERLSAMRANASTSHAEVEVASESRSAAVEVDADAPVVTAEHATEVTFDPEASLEDVLPPESETAPNSEVVAERTVFDVQEESGEPSVAPELVESPEEEVEAFARAQEVSSPLTASAPPAFVPVDVAALPRPEAPPVRDEAPVAPPLPWESAPAPDAQVLVPLRSETPTPQSPSSPWAQRLAGRDGIRDTPINATPRPSAEPVAPSAPTEALERASGGLARLGGEGVTGEAESRNRALYRQKHFVFDAVLGSLDGRALQNPTRETLKTPIERAVDVAGREFNLSLDNSDRSWLVEEFIREVTDLGPLVTLLDDVTVNKILVVGSTDVAVERFGRIERTGVSFRDDDHLLSVVRRIAELTGGRIDAKVPLLDRPLPDGARIRAKIPPLAPQPTLTVEKSTGNPFTALKRQQADRGRENALPYAQLRERIQQRLLREFEGNAAALANPERLRAQVEEMIGLVIAEEKVAVSRAERASLVMDLLNEIVGLGPIEPLLNDPDVDEVMVNGPFQIYVERKGKLEIAPQRFRDNAHVMQVIERIVAPLGRRVDEKSPMVDGRLRDGSRFNAIIPPLSLSGPTMTIRKFARDPFTMTDLINFGSLSREAAQFLQAAVEGRMNIIVSGGTGSGKTTTLNVLSSFIPASERIVTIEDAAELQLRQEHVIRLETRPSNIEGSGEITIRDLVRNSLRMRPDRIVIGECRGGEALDMLQAMNTGHDGSLTTGHSNGPRDTIKRLETMVMMAGFDLPIRAIREQISMAIQFIVHQERMRDGKRRVTAITELVGMEGDVVTMQDIFRFEQDRVDDEGRIVGTLAASGLRPQNFDNIVDHGVNLSMDLFQPRNMGGRDGDLRSRLDHRVNTR